MSCECLWVSLAEGNVHCGVSLANVALAWHCGITYMATAVVITVESAHERMRWEEMPSLLN